MTTKQRPQDQKQPVPDRIRSTDELNQALAILVRLEPNFQTVIEEIGEIPLRLRPLDFRSLASVIVSQHVSEASAAAIFGRLKASLEPFSAPAFLELPEQALIDAGLTRAKQTTLRGLAQELISNRLDLHQITTLPYDEALARLTELKGIGPWTADVFLMQSAGYPDIFPAGDVALQQAIADVFGLHPRPKTADAARLARKWSPVQAAAARVLWAHYHHTRHRKDPFVEQAVSGDGFTSQQKQF